MTNDELKAIEDRANAATVGPWKACEAKDAFDNWPVCPSLGTDDSGKHWAVSTDNVHASDYESEGAGADAEFIAHARADIPALIAEVRRLQTLCASHEEYIEGSERDAF